VGGTPCPAGPGPVGASDGQKVASGGGRIVVADFAELHPKENFGRRPNKVSLGVSAPPGRRSVTNVVAASHCFFMQLSTGLDRNCRGTVAAIGSTLAYNMTGSGGGAGQFEAHR
jgi:hypothetical protein